MLTDSELADLFDELESDRVERKQSLNQTDRIHQAICAFANDFPDRKRPGVIFLGVNDDGSCSNLQITDQILLKLADMRSDGNTLPFPMVMVEKRKIRECEVGVVVVEPSTDPPVRYRGRTWIRVGPSLRQATAADGIPPGRKTKSLGFTVRPPPSLAAVHSLTWIWSSSVRPTSNLQSRAKCWNKTNGRWSSS